MAQSDRTTALYCDRATEVMIVISGGFPIIIRGSGYKPEAW